MKQLKQLSPSKSDGWLWPVNLNAYDRNPSLTEIEQAELDRVLLQHGQIHKKTKRLLKRLIRPITDVLTSIRPQEDTFNCTLRILCIEMQSRRTAFWAWDEKIWQEIICPTPMAFKKRYGFSPSGRSHAARPLLPVIAYLLCPHLEVDPLLPKDICPFARRIFGKEAVETAIERIITLLIGWGYRQRRNERLNTCLCYLLLKNRSPILEQLTLEHLEQAQKSSILTVTMYAFQASRALAGLGILATSLPGPTAPREPAINTDDSLSKEWISWVQRWQKYSTLQKTASTYYALLSVGRWLHAHHPEITAPSHWTYDLAIEFVAAVGDMKVGEWANPTIRERRIPAHRLGQPLRPYGKSRLLSAVRMFFHDCMEWEWMPRQFNPDRAFKTPKPLRNLLGPHPRVISKELWAKILWAAMNLEAKDLPVCGNGNDLPTYPIEMVRAIAVVWCFTALRSDEIRRLRLGCIRWQYEDVMVPETGSILPRDAVCFLDVPVNKTSTAYTKPIHPLVGQRINEWEKIRPQQLAALDKKTSESVQFLFSYRGKRISPDYLNQHLIPILCRKAGIPAQDSRGQITSHRARATIASMLYNAREPLSIFELKEYLGHKHLSSTQSYLLVDPTKLATKVAKAGYLEQNLATIEVLLDQEAIMSGEAARGSDWKLYDLGHGFCANPFWAECAHRMACARCPFYRPKNSTMEHLLEGKANLVRMLEFVSLTEDERLLVTEGIELHQALLEKLVDEPTLAGPTPRQLAEQQQHRDPIIPLHSVQRVKQKT